MIDLYFIEDLGLNIEVLRGLCKTQDLIEFIKNNIFNFPYNTANYTIVDLRDAVFDINPDEIDVFTDELKRCPNCKRSPKYAYLSSSPENNALTLIYNEKISNDTNGKIFLTLKAALDYLDLSVFQSEIGKYFKNDSKYC